MDFPKTITVKRHTHGEKNEVLSTETAFLSLQDAPYDEEWAAYYCETEDSQLRRGGETGPSHHLYEVWINVGGLT